MSAKGVVGGISGNLKDADDIAKQMVSQVRQQVEAKSNRKFDEFTAICFKTQLVNGVNYFLKVRVSDGEHLHLRVHKALAGEITLAAIQEKKTLEDLLEHFS